MLGWAHIEQPHELNHFGSVHFLLHTRTSNSNFVDQHHHLPLPAHSAGHQAHTLHLLPALPAGPAAPLLYRCQHVGAQEAGCEGEVAAQTWKHWVALQGPKTWILQAVHLTPSRSPCLACPATPVPAQLSTRSCYFSNNGRWRWRRLRSWTWRRCGPKAGPRQVKLCCGPRGWHRDASHCGTPGLKP